METSSDSFLPLVGRIRLGKKDVVLIYPSHTKFPFLFHLLRLHIPHSSSQNDGRGSHCASHSSSMSKHSGLLSHRVASAGMTSWWFVACLTRHRVKPLDCCWLRQNLWLICSLDSTENCTERCPTAACIANIVTVTIVQIFSLVMTV